MLVFNVFFTLMQPSGRLRCL